MNEIVNTSLLAGDKFVLQMHLRQPVFKKFKWTGYSQYVYQNELNKASFQHDMPYGDFEDLTRT